MNKALSILFYGLMASAITVAHEIPSNITLRAFIKPEGDRMELLVRVPLEAMQDMQIPTREGGYLDLERIEPVLQQAAILWISGSIDIYENETLIGAPTLLAARVSLPSNRTFDHYATAREHLQSPPLPKSTEIYWNQALLDVLFEYSIRSDQSEFSINSRFDRLGIRVINNMRFLRPDGFLQKIDFSGASERIFFDPNWVKVAWTFTKLGFLHILEGIDHLLFLVCLIIPFRKLRSLIPIISSFTVAHSLTLAASALGYGPNFLWFPALIETLIAISILYMAFQNILAAHTNHRWIITFLFGLIHGFGFSFSLRETFQFAGSHLTASLLFFNIGIELGQIFLIILTIPALHLLALYGGSKRLWTIILSALIAHSAWHWMVERGEILSQYGWQGLGMNIVLARTFLEILILIVILSGIVWFWSAFMRPGKFFRPHKGGISQDEDDIHNSDL